MRANTDINRKLFLDENRIKKSHDVVLFGINIDDKQSFQKHIEKICRTPNTNYMRCNAYKNYLRSNKLKSLCNAFISSQFFYAPLTWIFIDRYKSYMIQIKQLIMNYF